MAAHTPGPWEADAEEGMVFRVLDGGERDEDIATVWGSDEDARLIAAAPDLLAALERLLRAQQAVSRIRVVDEGEYDDAMDAASAAIAKATGK